MRNGEAPQHLIRWSPADWATSTVRARSARTGDAGLRVVYFELLNALYLEGGELPTDPEKLADNLLLPAKEIARVLPILTKELGAITIHGGRLSQPRVTKELQRSQALTEVRRRAGRSAHEQTPANEEQMPANAGKTSAKGNGKGLKATAKATAKAITEVFEYWQERTGHTDAVLTADRRKKLRTRLEEERAGAAGLKRAVDGAVADPFYAGENDRKTRYWSFDNVFRSRDRVEKLQDSAQRYGRPGLAAALKKLKAAKLPPHDNAAAALFEDVKKRLTKIPARSKQTWVDPCDGRAFENEGTVLVVTCPSDAHVEWLRGYYKEPLKAALHEVRPGMLVRAVVWKSDS